MIAAQTIIVSQPIHWEAVLITAVPAAIGGVFSIAAAIIAKRAARLGATNKEHLQSIDRAVNGTEPHEATLRENVEAINHAVNGAEPEDQSIRQNVEALVQRKDMDPAAEAPTVKP